MRKLRVRFLSLTLCVSLPPRLCNHLCECHRHGVAAPLRRPCTAFLLYVSWRYSSGERAWRLDGVAFLVSCSFVCACVSVCVRVLVCSFHFTHTKTLRLPAALACSLLLCSPSASLPPLTFPPSSSQRSTSKGGGCGGSDHCGACATCADALAARRLRLGRQCRWADPRLVPYPNGPVPLLTPPPAPAPQLWRRTQRAQARRQSTTQRSS